VKGLCKIMQRADLSMGLLRRIFLLNDHKGWLDSSQEICCEKPVNNYAIAPNAPNRIYGALGYICRLT